MSSRLRCQCRCNAAEPSRGEWAGDGHGLAAGPEKKRTNCASGTLKIRVSDAMLMLAARDSQVLAAQNSRTGALAAQTDALAARLGRMP